jgi:hypothetical protein
MAHFAQLDDQNNVIDVVAVSNSNINDLPFPESEQVGIDFLNLIFGEGSVWKQTSYNANFRKNYAAIGGRYDPALDAFIDVQPYPSWTLDQETCQWVAPIPYDPSKGDFQYWDEAQGQWVVQDLGV